MNIGGRASVHSCGEEDERDLTGAVCQYLESQVPRAFVLENVIGMLSKRDSAVTGTILFGCIQN